MAQTRITFRQLKQLYGYSVFYKMVNANTIFNLYGPDCILRHKSKSEKVADRRSKRYAELKIQRRNKKDNFYANLEHNILSNGFKNPIMVYANIDLGIDARRIPARFKNKHNILICVHGGSRLYYAQKYKMQMPCIICAWSDRAFKNDKEITSEAEFLSMYQNPPRFKITPKGLEIIEIPHIHMP